jgi:hypothetical protein
VHPLELYLFGCFALLVRDEMDKEFKHSRKKKSSLDLPVSLDYEYSYKRAGRQHGMVKYRLGSSRRAGGGSPLWPRLRRRLGVGLILRLVLPRLPAPASSSSGNTKCSLEGWSRNQIEVRVIGFDVIRDGMAWAE